MPGFVPRPQRVRQEKFGMSNDMNSPKGQVEQNVVCGEQRADSDTRHPTNSKWVKRSRSSTDYDHQI